MQKVKKIFILFLCLGLVLLTACPPLESSVTPDDDPTPVPATTPDPTIIPSPPPDSPFVEGIRFLDKDIRANYISGRLIINKASDESNVSLYKIYLGSDESTLTTNILQLAPTGQDLVYNLPSNNLTPGIKFLLVITVNSAGIDNTNSADIRAMPIEDLVVESAADINPAGSGNPQNLQEHDFRLYFKATDNGTDYKLMYYDEWQPNTVTKTFDITNPPAGAGNVGSPDYLTVFNDKLYFQAYTDNEGVELWSCNKDDELELVSDISPGSTHSVPKNFRVYQAPGAAVPRLYFQATGDAFGSELYYCDKYNNVTYRIYYRHIYNML